MATRIRVRRGTRSQINAAAAGGQLIQYEPLFITDEDRFGVATSTTTYATTANEGEGGSGTVYVGDTAPDPNVHKEWYTLEGCHFVWDGEFWFQVTGATGAPGTPVEFQTTATHIQWRYVGDATWIDLVALNTLGSSGGTSPILSWML